MAELLSPALKAVSDAVLAVASQLSVDEVLQRLVDRARELAGARYAALGVPDGEGGFRRFLVAGMSDELIAAMGPLPRTHGMLGAMLDRPRRTGPTTSTRTRGSVAGGRAGTRTCARSSASRSSARGRGDRRLLPDRKEAADVFDADDQELIEILAAHAAIAITNARLYERSRELSVLAERNRLALELHDVVSQKLFSLMLTAEVAATQLDRDPTARTAAARAPAASWPARRSTSCAR